MMSSENFLRACLLFLEILSPPVNLFTIALTMTLGYPHCSFRDFNTVAYMTPFDPRPAVDEPHP